MSYWRNSMPRSADNHVGCQPAARFLLPIVPRTGRAFAPECSSLPDTLHNQADDTAPLSFDPIPLSPEAAQSEIARRDLLARDYRERMAQQSVAAMQASIDMLCHDPAIVRQNAPGLLRGLRRRLRRKRDSSEDTATALSDGLLLPNWYAQRSAGECDGKSALSHYLAKGLPDELAPNPFFDPGWYRARYMLSDGGTTESAIGHYLRIGARHGLSPGPLFDSASYLRAYPEVVEVPDLLADFIVRGLMQGRRPRPVPLPLPPS